MQFCRCFAAILRMMRSVRAFLFYKQVFVQNKTRVSVIMKTVPSIEEEYKIWININ